MALPMILAAILRRHRTAFFLVTAATVGVLLVGVMVATTLQVERERRSIAMVQHTFVVDELLAALLSILTDAETGQRGYLITGRESYLQPYADSVARVGRQIGRIAAETGDNPGQQARIARLRPLVDQKLGELDRTIALRRLGQGDEAIRLVLSDEGKMTMDAIRVVVGEMREEEARLLAERKDTRDTILEQLRVFVIGSNVMVVLLLIGVTVAARRLVVQLQRANALAHSEMASREAAENQLRQAQKMEAVGQLTGGIAHDFNNMLAVILGGLELAKRRLAPTQGDVVRLLEAATEGAQRATKLTGQLLAYSRQLVLRPDIQSPNKTVQHMAELLHRTLPETIAMQTVLAAGVWNIHVDSQQLESALLNLCLNARDAMPDGGQLTIETSNAFLDEAYAAAGNDVRVGQYVLLAVTDTGRGMSPETIARAFDPFFTTKPVGKGTGLGLSQILGFVRQSGGHVKIYSEVGTGTTVKVYLPRHEGNETPAAAAAAAVPRGRRGETVLLVEDDDRVRSINVALLQELGYTVIEASRPSEALSALDTHEDVSLLFTDVVMPEMSGRALADEARRRRPGLRVLYTTGYTRNAIVHNGVVDRDARLLIKPFTAEQLAVAIRAAIDA